MNCLKYSVDYKDGIGTEQYDTMKEAIDSVRLLRNRSAVIGIAVMVKELGFSGRVKSDTIPIDGLLPTNTSKVPPECPCDEITNLRNLIEAAGSEDTDGCWEKIQDYISNRDTRNDEYNSRMGG